MLDNAVTTLYGFIDKNINLRYYIVVDIIPDWSLCDHCPNDYNSIEKMFINGTQHGLLLHNRSWVKFQPFSPTDNIRIK